eukprot:sb/3476112/
MRFSEELKKKLSDDHDKSDKIFNAALSIALTGKNEKNALRPLLPDFNFLPPSPDFSWLFSLDLPFFSDRNVYRMAVYRFWKVYEMIEETMDELRGDCPELQQLYFPTLFRSEGTFLNNHY